MLVAEILDSHDVYMRTSYTLRLIPEMNFTCNGTIVGFTVAGWRRPSRDDFIPIEVQIWRKNSSLNSTYYITDNEFEIEINESVCTEVFLQAIEGRQVWKCNLNATGNQVEVQAGDVLGILLPPRTDISFLLSIARVSRGPTNYIFENQEVLPGSSYSPDSVNLSNASSKNYQLPQIFVQIESGTA